MYNPQCKKNAGNGICKCKVKSVFMVTVTIEKGYF